MRGNGYKPGMDKSRLRVRKKKKGFNQQNRKTEQYGLQSRGRIFPHQTHQAKVGMRYISGKDKVQLAVLAEVGAS